MFFSLVYEKAIGNGTTYPPRPYRSRDYLISSEPSTSHRTNFPYLDDELISNRRSILKETDLDRIRIHPNETMKTLPINRNQTYITPSNSQEEQSNLPPPPLPIQRRPSFQAATQLNNLDFYSNPDSYFFLDKPTFLPSFERNPYSTELDKRSNDYSSSYSKSNPISQKMKNKRTSVESSSKFIFNNDDGIFV